VTAKIGVSARPELLDLGGEVAHVVSDGLDERAAGVAIDRSAEARELLSHPVRELLLGHLVHVHLPRLGNRLGEGRVLLHAVTDEREDRGRRRRCEVRLDLLHVRGLPGLDSVDDDGARVAAEEAECVAGGDRGLAGGLGGVQLLGGVLTDPRSQPL
jgi:hypothetical protein